MTRAGRARKLSESAGPSLLDAVQPYKIAVSEVLMSSKRDTGDFKKEALRQVI